MKQKEISERLTRAFARAKVAAYEKVETEDRGVFNFDTATIRIPRVSKTVVEAAGRAAHVTVEKRSGRSGEYWVFIHQGVSSGACCLRRTEMNQAAHESLRQDPDLTGIDGFSASMYYKLD